MNVAITVVVELRELITIEPRTVAWLGGEAQAERTFTVTMNDTGPIHLLGLASSRPGFDIRICDPHIAVTYSGRFGIVDGEVAFDIWLLDSMPVTFGARCASRLVVFHENGQIRTVIPVGTVDMPLTP